MNRIVLLLLVPFLLATALLPTPAGAVLITVNFAVLGDPRDPLNSGTAGTGSFTFDSSLATPGADLYDNTSGLGLSSISFTWDGHTWSTVDADAYRLRFDASGNLFSWNIGGFPVSLAGQSASTFQDFIAAGSPGGAGGTFSYTTANSPSVGGGIYTGTLVSWSVASTPPSVALPGTLSLCGLGLVPLGWMNRRRSAPGSRARRP
jgi:hypothetical protein